MTLEQLQALIVTALEDLKAVDTEIIDVREVSSFTDLMVVASGTSTRQVKALAERLIEHSKAAGVSPLGVEGERDAEWILIDLGDAVVHIMLPAVREFYSLEKLWSVRPEAEPSANAGKR